MVLRNYPDTLLLSCGSSAEDNKEAPLAEQEGEDGDGNDAEEEGDESSEPAGVKLKRKVSSLFKKKPQRSILKKTGRSAAAEPRNEEDGTALPGEGSSNNNNTIEVETLIPPASERTAEAAPVTVIAVTTSTR